MPSVRTPAAPTTRTAIRARPAAASSARTATDVPGCHDDHDCDCHDAGSPEALNLPSGRASQLQRRPGLLQQGSPGGGFVCQSGNCVPGATTTRTATARPSGGFVCEDGHCVPGTTTTTHDHDRTPRRQHAGWQHHHDHDAQTLHRCTTDCPIGVCRDGFCVPVSATPTTTAKPRRRPARSSVIDGRLRVRRPRSAATASTTTATASSTSRTPTAAIRRHGQLLRPRSPEGPLPPAVRARQSAAAPEGRPREERPRRRRSMPVGPAGARPDPQRRSPARCSAPPFPPAKFVQEEEADLPLLVRSARRSRCEMGREHSTASSSRSLKSGQVRFRVKGKQVPRSRRRPRAASRITLGFTRPGDVGEPERLLRRPSAPSVAGRRARSSFRERAALPPVSEHAAVSSRAARVPTGSFPDSACSGRELRRQHRHPGRIAVEIDARDPPGGIGQRDADHQIAPRRRDHVSDPRGDRSSMVTRTR